MQKKSILYAGDGDEGGAANYLLGILRNLPLTTLYNPSHKPLNIDDIARADAIILSDYSASQIDQSTFDALTGRIESGAGLLMIGGWGSFSGPFGGWHKSPLEALLPVNCLSCDDRTNFPGGALIIENESHNMFTSLSFSQGPVICGLNRFEPKSESRVLLSVKKILQTNPGNLKLEDEAIPFFVIDRTHRRAALATDVAPHWCGGFVDWGNESKKLKVCEGIQIEVGTDYIRFFESIIQWILNA